MKMKNIQLNLLILSVVLIFFSCNPDCDSLSRVQTEISPSLRQPGEEVLVKTSPAGFLENKNLYLERMSNGSLVIDDSTMLESTYNSELQARIAVLPAWAEGNRNIYIKDEDCGGFFPLNNLQIADQDYVTANASLFITPAPPVIIVPSAPIPSPTNVVNTWFSPDNPEYCIWFFPDTTLTIDGLDSCFVEKNTLLGGNVVEGFGSRELHCSDPDGNDHNNPVSGIIDKSTGYVDFVIDRRLKGLGEERFVGHMVEPKSMPADYQSGTWCGKEATYSERTTIMCVKSQLTGRQLILYRYANEDIENVFPCN